MTRRCSHCSQNGHNSRTCPNRGVKIFGVRLDSAIRKSASMGNLSLLSGSSGGASPADGPDAVVGGADDGYASEDCAHGSSAGFRERKKGVPWTEEEHRRFLLGLKRLGKGDWRGISRNFVFSRTPTQVASHAQKYFIRQTNVTRRKRRSSLFDMVPDEASDLPPLPAMAEPDQEAPDQPELPEDEIVEQMDSDTSFTADTVAATAAAPIPETLPPSYPVVMPAFFTPYLQLPLPVWTGQTDDTPQKEQHEIVRPIPIHSKVPINLDELVSMSKLSIGEQQEQEPVSTSLSLSLIGGGQHRQSAFHASTPTKAQA